MFFPQHHLIPPTPHLQDPLGRGISVDGRSALPLAYPIILVVPVAIVTIVTAITLVVVDIIIIIIIKNPRVEKSLDFQSWDCSVLGLFNHI